MDAQTVKSMPIKEVVDDKLWQHIRSSLVGHWIKDHKFCVSVLQAYLDVEGWSPIATRRVLNVLTGTVHRTGRTASQKETNLLRKRVRCHWKHLLEEPYDSEDPKYSQGTI